jgi:hypothetical protein
MHKKAKTLCLSLNNDKQRVKINLVGPVGLEPTTDGL